MKRPMRVEMVLPSLPRAGMEVVTAALVRGLARRGYDVGVTCLQEADVLGEELRREGFRVSVVPTPGVLPNFIPGALASWLRQVNPDVVHAHTGGWLKTATSARAAGIERVVNTLHGFEGADEPWKFRVLARLAIRRTDRIVAVSESIQRHLLYVYRAPSERVALILNGISTERFRPRVRDGALRLALGIPEQAFVIGHVARHRAVKNQAMLLEAFARLTHERADAFLIMVGDGPLREELEQRVLALRIEHHVRFLGDLQDTTPVYQEFDVFVLSSTMEGTSVSMLEAMASGVPVVATAVGGNPVLLRHGECGVLVPSGDPASLTDALKMLAADADCRANLAERARSWVETSFSERAMLDQYEVVYGAQPAGRAGAVPEERYVRNRG